MNWNALPTTLAQNMQLFYKIYSAVPMILQAGVRLDFLRQLTPFFMNSLRYDPTPMPHCSVSILLDQATATESASILPKNEDSQCFGV